MSKATTGAKLISNAVKLAAEATVQPAAAAIGTAAITGSMMAAGAAGGLSSLFLGCLLLGAKRDAQEQRELEGRLREFIVAQGDVRRALEKLATEVPWANVTMQGNARALLRLLESRADGISAQLARQESLVLYVSEWIAAQGSELSAKLDAVNGRVAALQSHLEDAPPADDGAATGRGVLRIRIGLPADAWDDAKVQDAVRTLQRLCVSFELRHTGTERGSIVLVFDAPDAAYQRLARLEEHGGVSGALGAFVEDITWLPKPSVRPNQESEELVGATADAAMLGESTNAAMMGSTETRMSMDRGVLTVELAAHAFRFPSFEQQLPVDVLRQFSTGHVPRVVISLERMPYVTSAALGALLSLHIQVTRLGGRLVLAAVHPGVHEAIRVTGLDRVIQTYPTLESARVALER